MATFVVEVEERRTVKLTIGAKDAEQAKLFAEWSYGPLSASARAQITDRHEGSVIASVIEVREVK